MGGGSTTTRTTKRVLILGGGYGGVYAALRLQKLAKHRRDIDITMVNRENFFLFTPMLPQAATSSIDTRHVVQAIRRICPQIRFYEADVDRIDLERRAVTITHEHGPPHELGFDHLLIAMGGETNFFGLPGVAERAITIKTLSDAMRVRNHAIDMLEQAEIENDAALRRRLLTFVVAGAGFAGIETAAELDTFLRSAAQLYKNVKPSDINLIIVDLQNRLLPELSERLGQWTQAELTRRGVETRLGARVKSAGAGYVEFADGRRIETMTFIWAGGVKPSALISALPCANERGRIRVDENLAVGGYENIWAVGDCAEVYPPGGSKPYPPTAQHALREGSHAGSNIVAAIDGKPLRPFGYTMIGQMANLGQYKAVAMVGGIKLSGFPAWWLWRTYYLLRMPTLERKIRVAIDWTLDLFFTRDTVKLTLPRD